MFSLKKNQNPVANVEESSDNDIALLYENATEMAGVGVWEINIISEKITWTKAAKNIHEVNESFKPDFNSVIHFYKPGVNRETITRLIKNAVEKGQSFNEELQIITAKGNERWIRVKGKAQFSKNKCTRLYGVFYDIHADKLKDARFEYSRQLFTQTFDNAPIGIAMVATDGKLLNINERVCDYVGYSKDELLQISFSHLTHPEDMGKDFDLMQQLLNGEINTYNVEKRFIDKEDCIVWMLLSISLVRDANRQPMHFIMHLSDISRKKENEKLLKDERILLQTLIDNLPLNVYVKDLKSRKVLVNKMEAAYMNVSKKEILGKNDYELFPHESADISIKEDKEVFTSGVSMIDKETVSKKHDGGETWFLSSKIAYRDEFNEIKGLLGISYDITERKKYEQKLKNLTLASELQNTRLSNFIQTATNNLRLSGSELSGLIHTLENKNAIDHKEIIDSLKTVLQSLTDSIKNLINTNQ